MYKRGKLYTDDKVEYVYQLSDIANMHGSEFAANGSEECDRVKYSLDTTILQTFRANFKTTWREG